MILLDQPYVSDYLRRTILEHGLPVVLTPEARALGAERFPSAITEAEAVARARAEADPLVYNVSETSLAWVVENLADTALPDRIAQFKDKARFRRDSAALFPGFEFCEVAAEDLDSFDPERFPAPFMLKPSVGFFSLGVQRVDSADAWPAARARAQADLARAHGLFPEEVLSTSRFLIEPCIEGREFAVDAYHGPDGKPVILSILEHEFSSKSDMSDRLYVTSAEIVRSNLARFTGLLEDLARLFPAQNHALHLELRVDAHGRLWPIEINPMRFGGWCTTADLTHFAFGIDPYALLYAGERPDWEAALAGKEGKRYALIALGNSTGVNGADIRSFDYDRLVARFRRPLEVRPTDFRRYPIFGFVFTETRDEDVAELQWALHSDLREFVDSPRVTET